MAVVDAVFGVRIPRVGRNEETEDEDDLRGINLKGLVNDLIVQNIAAVSVRTTQNDRFVIDGISKSLSRIGWAEARFARSRTKKKQVSTEKKSHRAAQFVSSKSFKFQPSKETEQETLICP